MKIILKTTYPCLVKCNNETFELDENDKIEIENEEFVFIYPAVYSKRAIPFYINLKSLKKTARYSVFEMDEFTLILLEASEITVENRETLVINGEKCEVFVANNELRFECKNHAVSCTVKEPLSDYKVFKIGSYALLETAKDLFAFNTQNITLSHFGADEKKFERDTLHLLKRLNDCENRVKSAKYRFKDDQIKVESLAFEYENLCKIEELAPYRFLEAIKAKDFRFAQNLLAEKMNANEDALANFFGNVVKFLPLSTTEFIVIGENEKNFARFEVSGGQIVDISVDKLV